MPPASHPTAPDIPGVPAAPALVVPWLEGIAYDCLVMGIAKVNDIGVEIVDVLDVDGEFNESSEKLVGYCNSLLFLWFNRKAPVVLDFDACECVGKRILQRGKTRRFIVHGILLDSTHIGFIILSKSGRWDVDEVKTVLAAQEVQLEHDTRRRFVAAPFFTDNVARFTPRELEVLQLLAEGGSNKVIAKGLGISHNTVRNQVQGLFRKTGTVNRTQLAKLFSLEKQ
ncbi:MAG: LuxR C-terminal-related transcriptional regulator [Pseudomonadota bacterium]